MQLRATSKRAADAWLPLIYTIHMSADSHLIIEWAIIEICNICYCAVHVKCKMYKT